MKRFYIFLLALICLSVGLEANAQVITTLPWSDDFEGGLTKWVIENENPNYTWTTEEGNPYIYSNLKNAHSGVQNAYLFAYGYTSTLLSPIFNLNSQSDVVISFWYSMYGSDSELTLFYRKSSGDSWTQLTQLTTENDKWCYAQVHLTDFSSSVQFKLEGYAYYSILLDDFTVKATDYWTDEGNYDIAWYDNSGNYNISTPAQLAGLAYLVNGGNDFYEEIINLTADIDLSGHEWVPIGTTTSNDFEGYFYGQNHTIDNLLTTEQDFSNYYGLFGAISLSEIKDVTIGENSFIIVPYHKNVGGIAGYNDGNSTIKNCVNKATICGYENVGGIIGQTYSTTISNCYNYGDVLSNYSFVGGIIGYISAKTTVKQCGNYGTIKSETRGVGGIAGYGYRGIFDKCFNKGDVNAGYELAGGISGEYGYIVNCYNTGTVSVNNQYAGGICGYMDGAEPIYNSYNRGRVYAGSGYAGGIVGSAEEGSSVVNVYNSAIISANVDYGAVIGYLDGNESNSTLLGYYNNYYTNDDLSSMTGLSGYDMKNQNFVTTLNGHLYMNPNSDYPWANWGIYQLTNEGYPTFAEFAENGRYWISEGNYNISWFAPSATTYNIGTAADLAGVAYLCDLGGETFAGKTIKLTADIDLAGHEWVAIGNKWDPIKFSGNFDGNNHIISNLYSEYQDFSGAYGLIGHMYDSPTALYVKNLTIDATCEINVPNAYNLAGVVASVQLDTLIMTNCKNYANITGYGELGGVLGGISYDNDQDNALFKISQCENYGNINGNSVEVSGIIGYCDANVEIEGCTNYGDVSSVDGGYIGGITGYIYYSAKIANCANYGNVRSYGNYIGGIVGHANDKIIIDNCLNTGDIVSYDGVLSYDDYVGGIAGYISGYQSEVRNCKNTGTISGAEEVGGIIGETFNGGDVFENYPGIYVFVSDCQNEGDVFSYSYDAAGIVGYAPNNSVWVDKCSNSGKITGDYYVGGITGYKGSVSNSYNTGDIAGHKYSGGIVGYAYGASEAYELVGNCYNRGNVTAEYYAGGIAGYIYEYVEANNCYTTGEISASSYRGAVIGYIDYENDTKLSALFYPEELDNASGYGTSMSDSNMKTNILLDALNASVNLWNVSNTYNVPFEAWEFRNGVNDGYPVFGFSNVSVSEVAETGSFSVYPNPAKDYVMIVNEKGTNAEIRVFDIFGKLVKSIGTTSDTLIRVDVSDLTNGVYVIRMGNETVKIVKQ